jgi:hypothetical protein
MKQLAPREREIDLLGGKKRLLHLSVLLHDLNIVNSVRPPPKLEIDITHLTGIRGDFVQAPVDRVADGEGSRPAGRKQNNDNYQQNDQGFAGEKMKGSFRTGC